jgi:hypothetical protein
LVFGFVVRLVRIDRNPVNVGLQGVSGRVLVVEGGRGRWRGRLSVSWVCGASVCCIVVRVVRN